MSNYIHNELLHVIIHPCLELKFIAWMSDYSIFVIIYSHPNLTPSLKNFLIDSSAIYFHFLYT